MFAAMTSVGMASTGKYMCGVRNGVTFRSRPAWLRALYGLSCGFRGAQPANAVNAPAPAAVEPPPWKPIAKTVRGCSALALLLTLVAPAALAASPSSCEFVGVNVDGIVCPNDDVDWFPLQVPSRGSVEAVVETSDSLGAVVLTLENDEGREIAREGAAAGRDFRIEETVEAGTYHLRVTAFDDYDEEGTRVGSFALRVSHTPARDGSDRDDDTRADATPIDLGTDVRDAIDPAGDVDWWRFDLPSRGEVVMGTTGGVDTVGRLVDASGNFEAENDDARNDLNFRIERTLDAGTWYVRVTGYSNNDTGSYTLRVDHTPDTPAAFPDLVVESVSVSDASLDAGASFTLSGRVRNGGDGAAEASTLRYYRSTDTSVSSSDTAVGSGAVGGLGAGASSSESINLTAPSGAGTYYYGACVDPVAGESDRANNCSNGVRVTVTVGTGGGGGTGGSGGGAPGRTDSPPGLRLGDLNGDGHDDVLVRHGDSGAWLYYAMDAQGGTPYRNLGLTTNLDWAPAGVGDLDGDGYDDLLMRHAANGQWLYYRMDGRRGRLVRNLGLTPNRDWRFAGLGDFDRDGDDDVLLRHATNGQWIYYEMNGERGRLVRNFGATANRAWTLAGVEDLNGDGYDDLLLRHTDSGAWLYYDMSARRARLVRNVGLTSNRDWRFAGLGDFDGDGDDDVLLRHGSTGQWIYYAMNGERGRLVRNFGPTSNRAWVLAGVGDVNGDGHDDLVLRHATNGQWLYYDMGGSRARLVRNLGLTPNRDWTLPALAVPPADDPTDQDFVEEPLRDFDIGMPASCPREVEVCVRDHLCEDGDAVRVTVNGNEVFSGELFNARHCVTVPVREGANSIEMYALNGTGFKGACSHIDANSGQIDVIGGNEQSQTWLHLGGTGSNLNINVTVGGQGPCRPGSGGGDDGNDTRSGASALPIGAAADGSLDGPNDVDYWRIEVPSPGRVVIETTGGANTHGRLEDGSGNQLAEDDDGGTGDNFRIELDLDPGTYYVRVSGSRGGTGAYGLRVSHTAAGLGGGGGIVNFVAVNSNNIATSEDGVQWEIAYREEIVGDKDGYFPFMRYVTFADGLWVIVGDRLVYTSTDGRTWTQNLYTQSDYSLLRAAAYGQGRWVVVGQQALLTSTNAQDWSVVIARNDDECGSSPGQRQHCTNMHDVAYGTGLWVATNDHSYGASYFESRDGVNWMPFYDEPATSCGTWDRRLAFANDRWLMFQGWDQSYTIICTRTMAGHWVEFIIRSDTDFASDIFYGDGDWVAVGRGGIAVWREGETELVVVDTPFVCDPFEEPSLHSGTYRNGVWVVNGGSYVDCKGNYYNDGDPRRLQDWKKAEITYNGGPVVMEFASMASRP